MNKISNPKVSIIIPVYNTEKYLRRCLASVCGQTLREIEIICINDGSKDISLEILKEYAANDDRIVVIDQKNSGVANARNNGLQRATAPYIGFVDSDDYIAPDMYEIMYNTIDEYKVDFIECGIEPFFTYKQNNANGTIDYYNNYNPKGLISDPNKYILSTTEICNKLYKK